MDIREYAERFFPHSIRGEGFQDPFGGERKEEGKVSAVIEGNELSVPYLKQKQGYEKIRVCF